jgi:hypothetical protein
MTTPHAGTFRRVRRIARGTAVIGAAAACALAGCGGGGDYANKPRPPAPINVTAAISTKKISLSPKQFGSGPVVFIVSNQTPKAQTLTLQTEEIGGSQPGLKQAADPIDPGSTGTLKADVREGTYELSVAGGGPAPVTVKVGGPRASAQDQLLQP